MFINTIATFTGATAGTLVGSDPTYMMQASDDNLYGTTIYGVRGTASSVGTIFKCTTAGVLTTLVSNIGENIWGGFLIQASDGNLYGMNDHQLFQCTTAGVFTVIWGPDYVTFPGMVINPCLVEGSDGYLYGMLTYDNAGTFVGVLYKVMKDGTSFTTLYTYSSANDCMDDIFGTGGAMIICTDGNIYGFYNTDTYYNLFKIIPGGATSIYEMNPTTLVAKTYASSGDSHVRMIQGWDLNLYISGALGLFKCKLDGTSFAPLKSCFEGTLIPINGAMNILQGTDRYLYFADGVDVVWCQTNGGMQQSKPGLTYPYTGWGLLQGADGNLYGTAISAGYPDDPAPNFGIIFCCTNLTNLTHNSFGPGGAAYTYESGINY